MKPPPSPDTLASQLDIERAEAIQHLLRSPVVDVVDHRDEYSLIARHAAWLVEWFDTTCGWTMHVDPAVGFARLAKRRAQPDPTRPLLRLRGANAAFDRRRYELLCLVSAELLGHPMTTVGLLAEAIASSTDFAPDTHGDRVAFVDALLVLRSWRAITVTSGELEDFTGDERANALLTADLSRLHRLLTSATAPSAVDPGAAFDEVVATLLAEPRYGPTGQVDAADPHRWTRHSLARRLLDDPVAHLDDCTDEERDYLASGAGRTWLRTRLAQAGFTLEERADGVLAVDPRARSTDDTFPGPRGTSHQMALLLVDHLVDTQANEDGVLVRRPRDRTITELEAVTADRLAAHPAWAKTYQAEGGARRLTADAVAILQRFGLVRLAATLIEARPAICRYQPSADSPAAADQAASLF